jgi:uncharacterized membrane protein YfcA
LWSVEAISLITGAFFLAGLAKGVVGLGFVVVVLACLATTIGLKEAVALLVIPGIFTNFWQAVAGPDFLGILRRLWSMFTATIVGIWIGAVILATGNADRLIIVLGVVLILYSVISLRRPQIPSPGKAEVWLSPVMGISGGFVAGLTGSFIVPGILYMQALGLPRDMFVQAMGMVFLMIAVVLGLLLWRYQVLTAEIGLMSLVTLVPSSIGMIAGQKLRSHMSEQVFRQAFFVSLIPVGVYMFIKAIM